MINSIIKKKYNIDVTNIEKSNGGLTNFNYYIYNNKQKYFLKIYRKNTLEAIKQEIEFINCVILNGIKTPKVLKNTDNEYITIFNNSYYVLFEYIEGEYPPSTNENIKKIATIIANIHTINSTCSAKKKRYPLNLKYITYELDKYKQNINSELYNFFISLIQISKNIPFDNLPKSYNHCDIFLDNLIQKNDEIYIIDFEEVSYENSLFDISRCAYGCCRYKNKIDLEKYIILINSYMKHKYFTEQEKEYLYDYTVYTGLISLFWRYMEFNIYRPDLTKKNIYQELLYAIKNFLRIDKNKFYNKMFNKT